MKCLVWGLGLIAIATSGCIRFYSPGDKAAAEPPEAASAELEPPPLDVSREAQLLDEARAALEAEAWPEAARMAGEIRTALAALEVSEPPSAAYTEVFFGAVAVHGLARQGEVDDLDALFVLDEHGIQPEACSASYRELCERMASLTRKEEYEALFERVDQGPVSGMAARVKAEQVSSNYYFTSVPGMAGYSESSVGYFLKEHVVANLRQNGSKYGAVWIKNHDEAKLTARPQGERVAYQWKGEAANITATSCRGDIVGQLKVGSETYDIERCTKGTSHHRGGALTMSLPESAAARVDFEAGDAALVVFETKSVRGTGLSLDLGPVRLARVQRGKTQ